jgi:prepilin-type N-terminal cleavage/methylation domain-containing protein
VRFHARSNQSGFALIEVIASAAVLGLVTLAVYGGYNATLHSSGRERARAVAASLAEQDQERLRSFRPTDLATYAAAPRIVKVPAVTGVPYTVTSTVDWISDNADGSSSCTSEANLEDYLRITSTVTSGIIGDQTKPVVQRSLVAPPVGTFRQGLGTLIVRVTGKGTLPITSLPVKIVNGATNITDDTNSFGCAVFRYVPVGSYAISFSRPAYVDTKGLNLSTSSATVSEGTMNVVSLSYDRGATVLATFDTQIHGATCTPPTCTVSKGMEVTLETTDLPAPGYMSLPATATNQTGQLASVTTPLLYPFDSAYGVYSGGCTGANPQNLISPPLPVSPAFAKLPGGLDPGQLLYPVIVRQPALNIKVVQGATVIFGKNITAQPLSVNCTTQLPFRMYSYTGTGSTDPNRGWASKNLTTATGGFDPGLPYGKYEICADNGLTGSSARRTKAGSYPVDLNSPSGGAPVSGTTIDLNTAGKFTSSALCP